VAGERAAGGAAVRGTTWGSAARVRSGSRVGYRAVQPTKSAGASLSTEQERRRPTADRIPTLWKKRKKNRDTNYAKY